MCVCVCLVKSCVCVWPHIGTHDGTAVCQHCCSGLWGPLVMVWCADNTPRNDSMLCCPTPHTPTPPEKP